MGSETTAWAGLSDVFDPNNSHPDLEDNRLIALPTLLGMLPQISNADKKLAGLDFGCGGGWLAKHLSDLGCIMKGLDPEPKMIEAARSAFAAQVDFQIGGAESLPTDNHLDFMVSMMVLQFLNYVDLEDFSERAKSSLKSGGILAFATHTPAYIDFACTHTSLPFETRDGHRFLTLANAAIPVFRRSSEDYKNFFSGWGFQASQNLEITAEFRKQFPDAEPSNAPAKFLVMSFQA